MAEEGGTIFDDLRRRWLMGQLFRAQRKQRPATPDSLLEGRELFHSMGLAAPEPSGVAIRPARFDGVDVEWLVPVGADGSRVMLYLHGGAFAMGSAMVSRTMLALILDGLDVAGCSVDYRLAPEHPFPAALDDAVAAYAALLQDHAPGQVVVAGDSAGGGLAVALLVAARERGLPMPAAIAVTSPWADLTMTSPSVHDRARRDPALTPALMHVAAAAYLGGTPATEPLASPVFADLTGLPPMLVLVGTEEILFDDAITLVDHARRDGVEVETVVGEGLMHCWTGYAAKLPQSREALDTIRSFAARHLDAASPATDRQSA